MRLVIDQPVLAKALARVSGAVERRSSIPILANLLLRAEGGALTITATDMDMEAVASVQLMIDRPGACTVPAQTLSDIVKRLPEGAQIDLSMEGDSGQMIIRSGRSRFAVATLPPDDFPTFGAAPLDCVFTLPAKALAGLIDPTRFAVSTEETRYYLNGIYLHRAIGPDGPVLRATATDGHRLARAELPLPDGADDLPGIIVPRKAVAEIRKLLDTATEVEVAVSPVKLRLTAGDAVLTTKLIDGTFPDYERVIPPDNTRRLEVEAGALKSAIDRAAAISGDKTRAVKLCLDTAEITIHASSAENGSATETLDPQALTWTGGAMEIGFNARYLIDIIDAAGTDRIGLAMADGASPCVITDAAAGDASSLFVLMPMRV